MPPAEQGEFAMSDFRFDKIEQEVVLFLADGIVLEGTVFLAPHAYTHAGPQTLLELLREPEPFLPLRDRDGSLRLVNKGAVSHARLAAGTVEGPEGIPLGEKVAVSLFFFGGETLEGTLYIEMPRDKSRLKDFLNAAPDFFPFDCGESHYIINSRLLYQVMPL